MIWIYYLPVFFLGTIWGSFLNMAVYRVKHELDFGGRSFCDHNKKPLTPIDLIPIFSFLLFKGRCRHCGKPLPLLYPIVELLTGLGFVLALHRVVNLGLSLEWVVINFILLSIFVLFFIFFAAYDYLYWLVNVKAMKLALGFAVLVAIGSIFQDQIILSGWSSIAAGLVSGLVIWFIVNFTKGSGMGEGDIYLMAFAGIFVGLPGLLPLFLISTVSGSIIGIIKAIIIKKFHQVKIQFVPFISLGALATFFFQDYLLNWLYLDELFILFLNCSWCL